MNAGLPLLVLSILAGIVVVTWTLKGPGAAGRRRLVAALWAGALLACWGTSAAAGAGGDGSVATAAAFVVALAGLFVPQLQRLLSGRTDR